MLDCSGIEQGLRDGRSRGQGVETPGQSSDPWGFPPVPAGGIDSELSSLSGGMAGRQAGNGAVRRCVRHTGSSGAWVLGARYGW